MINSEYIKKLNNFQKDNQSLINQIANLNSKIENLDKKNIENKQKIKLLYDKINDLNNEIIEKNVIINEYDDSTHH